jgi:phosphoglycolate phosphatase
MLDALGGTGRRMYVATTKPAIFADRVVKHFGLDRHFVGVYGPGLDPRLDDKAALLSHLLETEAAESGETVMIGDTRNDVVAAKANGIRAVGVLWGYGTERELVDAGAEAVCGTPEEVVAWARTALSPVHR